MNKKDIIYIPLLPNQARLVTLIIDAGIKQGAIIGTQVSFDLLNNVIDNIDLEAHLAGWCENPQCQAKYHEKMKEREQAASNEPLKVLGRSVN